LGAKLRKKGAQLFGLKKVGKSWTSRIALSLKTRNRPKVPYFETAFLKRIFEHILSF
jgi:hypothetical protein